MPTLLISKTENYQYDSRGIKKAIARAKFLRNLGYKVTIKNMGGY